MRGMGEGANGCLCSPEGVRRLGEGLEGGRETRNAADAKRRKYAKVVSNSVVQC